MKAIVTVVGNDNVGIIAAVCIRLAKHNVNILDISQTIMQEKFTMIMIVDLAGATSNFRTLSDDLKALGTEMNLSIRMQREEIFDAMHSI